MTAERKAMIETVLMRLSSLGEVTHQEILEHCQLHYPSAIDGGKVDSVKWLNYLEELRAEYNQ